MVTAIDPHIRVFNQTTNDVAGETVQQARGIGTLELNKNRITVLSALTTSDRADYFSFKIKGNLKNIGLFTRSSAAKEDNLQGAAVRVQILDKNGRNVIADSSPAAATEKHDKYLDAFSGKLALSAGQYLIKVTRNDGVLNNVKPNYTFQLTAGKYKNDYDTKEYPALPASTLYPSVVPDIAGAITSSPPDGRQTTEVFSTDVTNALNLLI